MLQEEQSSCLFLLFSLHTMSLPTSTRALSLYRQILRAGSKMPTQNRRDFIAHKARSEFRKAQHETDVQQIDFHLRLADVQLESITIQAKHLQAIFDGDLIPKPKKFVIDPFA
jgi:hypothetical protein